jgi:hypothetical protein|tara:strand:+ start:613 stop:1269 length:657 start_codon:yes stop_codon:yes gene_type:complete
MGTYITLVDDLIAACENTSAEFLAYIPKMVDRAEERLVKDLDDSGLTIYTALTVTVNVNQVTLPTNTRIVKNINIVSNGSKINLLMRTDEFINDYWPVSASVAQPKYYARRDNTTVLIAPTPVSTYSGEVVSVIKPDTLTSIAPSNYFTDFAYDLLWNASMVEAMMFQKDYPTMVVFQNIYKELLDLQRNQARRTRRDDMQAPLSPVGGDNTLVPGSP